MAPSKLRALILEKADSIVAQLASRGPSKTVARSRVKPAKVSKRQGKSSASTTGCEPRVKQRRGNSTDELSTDVSKELPDDCLTPISENKLNWHKAKPDLLKAEGAENAQPEVIECEIVDNGEDDTMSKEAEWDSFGDDNVHVEDLLKADKMMPQSLDTLRPVTPQKAPYQRSSTVTTPSSTTQTQAVPSLSSSPGMTPTQDSMLVTPSPIKAFVRQLPQPSTFESRIDMPWLNGDLRITTCFRIAEVVRLELQPVPIDMAQNHSHMIELYARLKSMVQQQNGKANIQFADAFFPTKPPYLVGACTVDHTSAVAASILSACPESVHTLSSSAQSSKRPDYPLCRAIVRTKNAMKEVEVLKIRESSWSELEYIRGVVEPQYQDRDTK
jgi:hypothetical protein